MNGGSRLLFLGIFKVEKLMNVKGIFKPLMTVSVYLRSANTPTASRDSNIGVLLNGGA